ALHIQRIVSKDILHGSALSSPAGRPGTQISSQARVWSAPPQEPWDVLRMTPLSHSTARDQYFISTISALCQALALQAGYKYINHMQTRTDAALGQGEVTPFWPVVDALSASFQK